jgi:hypothetical protein
VIRTSFFIIILLSLSSCFEIVEDVTFKNDGSGIFKLIVNLSQSKNEINSLMKLDSSSGYNIPTEREINAYLDQALKTLKTTEGLTNISINRDFKNWVFEVKTNFKNTENLEKGLINLHSHYLGGEPFTFRNKLKYNGKSVEREVQTLDEKTRKELNKPTEKKIFAKAKYTTIYRFESTIEKSSNTRAKVSPTKKAIMLQSNVLNIINGKETIQNQIILNEP